MKLLVLLLGLSVWATASHAERPVTLGDCEAPSHYQILQNAPKLPQAFAHAQAVALSDQWIRWPQVQRPLEAGTRFRLFGSQLVALELQPGQPAKGADASLALEVKADADLPAALAARFPHVKGGLLLRLRPADHTALALLLRGAVMLVQEDAQGRVQAATRLQQAGALDALYAQAETAVLGATVRGAEAADSARGESGTHFALWAPTAQNVSLCVYAGPEGAATAMRPMRRDARRGVWAVALRDAAWGAPRGGAVAPVYTYLVDVHTPGLGLVRHRVTDPYSLALTADSLRSVAVDLNAAALQPAGWDRALRPNGHLSSPKRWRSLANTDLVVYELHPRDFSIGDATVPERDRGKYTAFTHAGSNGMQHLRALAQAGVTDLHLLPVFDIASVPERGCSTVPAADLARLAPGSTGQQAAVMKAASDDCFNWGYDPLHYTVPEGSYATDAADPARRIIEFRQMVMALHAAGLRVGMDVVYNHTSAAGNDAKSVLDRIVPGYYHRLDANGQVERSTCCDNTATEHRMMAKLMVDSAVAWVRHYRIDSFRFDLMGHQPKDAMLRLQAAVNQAAGRPIHLVGEGWNFGEVKDGARFVQASQGPLNGTGIATFSDRGRDALRGGACCDGPADVMARQGWINGLHYDRNAAAVKAGLGTVQELAQTADLVRVALAGTQKSYRSNWGDTSPAAGQHATPNPAASASPASASGTAASIAAGRTRSAAELDYAGQPAGYASQPGEVVNYVENHDNPTLFDINVFKLPQGTSAQDRARVQVLGLAVVALSQGVAYFYAGGELLRSKSLDRNSFDSGDWFNRLDWSLTDNGFGAGLPPQGENEAMWSLMRPLLEDAAIKPTGAQIRFTRDAFLDWLRIRASTPLLRLHTADEVQRRLSFPRAQGLQEHTAVVGHLNGSGWPGARFQELLYAINVDLKPAVVALPQFKGKAFALHPVQRAPNAADPLPHRESRWDAAAAELTVPPRTAVVYVLE